MLKCNCLPKILRTLTRRKYLNFDVVDLHFFSFVCSLVAQNFRLVRVDFQSYTLSTLLEVAHHFLELHQRSREQEHVVSKRRFVRQSDSSSPNRIPMPFDFCQRSSSFSAIWSTVLKSKLDKRSPCFVPSLSQTCRFLSPLRQSLSVPRIVSSRGWNNLIRYRIFQALSMETGDPSSQIPS